ncbi:hypothetical protein LPB73_09910 [Tardiphaga sp. 37S4]|uniref:hypothetical protein n=2 Tax=Nitrobacteraceae TaxID=41294 RepID=UPI001E64C610|nr:hypothetical protein [Tardiphaga sp. 37S4]UFS77665.1 hypothetical protein LPB73_09910 [Tardiphaga sp. 37S4]
MGKVYLVAKIPTRENWSAMLAWIAFAAAMPEVQPLQWSCSTWRLLTLGRRAASKIQMQAVVSNRGCSTNQLSRSPALRESNLFRAGARVELPCDESFINLRPIASPQ